jgi:hypothetical protein
LLQENDAAALESAGQQNKYSAGGDGLSQLCGGRLECSLAWLSGILCGVPLALLRGLTLLLKEVASRRGGIRGLCLRHSNAKFRLTAAMRAKGDK